MKKEKSEKQVVNNKCLFDNEKEKEHLDELFTDIILIVVLTGFFI